MREIKFRAWDKCLKVMFPIAEINFISYAIYSANPNITHIGNLGEHCTILMQFTGLKDKNGKKIYEGDVVKFYNLTKEIIWGGYWKYAAFGLHGKRKNRTLKKTKFTWDVLNPEIAKEIEIIGNIYENPELLEEEKAR